MNNFDIESVIYVTSVSADVTEILMVEMPVTHE